MSVEERESRESGPRPFVADDGYGVEGVPNTVRLEYTRNAARGRPESACAAQTLAVSWARTAIVDEQITSFVSSVVSESLRVIGLKSSAVKDFMRIQGVNDLNSNCMICQSAVIFLANLYSIKSWNARPGLPFAV